MYIYIYVYIYNGGHHGRSPRLPPPSHRQFEEAVRRATGKDPPFPPSIVAMATMPQRFEWLRKRPDDPHWRDDWIATVKRDITKIALKNKQPTTV